jgi:hypothetical protein
MSLISFSVWLTEVVARIGDGVRKTAARAQLVGYAAVI